MATKLSGTMSEDGRPGSKSEAKSSWLQFVLLSFLDSIFAVGNQRPLEMEDLGDMDPTLRCCKLHEAFVVHFSSHRSIWHALWFTVGYWKLSLAILLFAFSAALQLGPVMILNLLVRHFEGTSELNYSQLWALVILLFVFPALGSVAVAHSNAMMANIGVQVRNILVSCIYRKCLTISNGHQLETGCGRVLTLFSEDSTQIRNFLFFLNNAIVAPFQIAAYLYLIYEQVGVAVFVGLGYSIAVIPIIGIVMVVVYQMRNEKLAQTDRRVKLMQEALQGIRIIKYYAWEDAFVQNISAVRDKELRLLEVMGYIFNTVFTFFFLGATQIQSVLIFWTFLTLNNELDTSTAFTTLTLFGLMTAPFIFLPFGLQQYSQSVVSMKRIVQFLESEDRHEYIQRLDHLADDAIICMIDADFAWKACRAKDDVTGTDEQSEEVYDSALGDGQINKAGYTSLSAHSQTSHSNSDGQTDVEGQKQESEEDLKRVRRGKPTLSGLSLSIRKGQLVAVVGTVGAGKSSFLHALLGDMLLSSGEISMLRGQSVAYCAQSPCIVNASVQENILFGTPLDDARLNRAIFAAALQTDIDLLPNGLLTEIGERGINVSGGQKARIGLARAVYADADVYLLDDPLSAVDAQVGEHILRHCLLGCLKEKTVLLVTHYQHVLPYCDQIVILNEDGSMLIAGSYDNIVHSAIDVDKYLSTKRDQDCLSSGKNAAVTEENAGGTPHHIPTLSSRDTDEAHVRVSAEADNAHKEERQDGQVDTETYWAYFQQGGTNIFVLILLLQAVCQLLQVLGNFILAQWGEDTSDSQENGESLPTAQSMSWLQQYAACNLASVFALTLSRILLNHHRARASHTLHQCLLQHVIQFPVSFFDVTPLGRVLNRFSQDMATIDEDLANTISSVVSMAASILGSLVAIAVTTKGTFLLILFPLTYLYNLFHNYFRKSNTAIARLESVSRSPIYADFEQALSGGTATILAYNQSNRFIHRLEQDVDVNSQPVVLQQLASQWLCIRLDLLGGLIMFFLGAVAVASERSGFIPAGYLALGLSYAIAVTALLKMAVRVFAQMETQFNAVERVRYYLLHVPTEVDERPSFVPVAVTDDEDIEMQTVSGRVRDIPHDWPSAGVIEFVNVHMCYRDGPLVLKGVSFTVGSGDKVGIAGRTGCGKSSLVAALFRMEDLDSGHILIDGINIASIPRRLLRSKLCIIPQDPVMFSASVRFNLDPFHQCSDEELWQVLEVVNMKKCVQSLPNQLDQSLMENGMDFSVGQRQLMCIGRALLRKPRILVLDEATASIDAETDAFIQRMIRLKFSDCTVLTIAHRLHTIVDSTRILVMNKGIVEEYDTTERLLEREDGLFKQLWESRRVE